MLTSDITTPGTIGSSCRKSQDPEGQNIYPALFSQKSHE
jgi:hypothetical protein